METRQKLSLLGFDLRLTRYCLLFQKLSSLKLLHSEVERVDVRTIVADEQNLTKFLESVDVQLGVPVLA